MSKKQNYTKLYFPLSIGVLVVFNAIFNFSSLNNLAGTDLASATALQQAFVRFDRLSALTQTTGRICAKPTTAISTSTSPTSSVAVTFPTVSGTDYVLGTAANFTVTTTALDSGQTAWPGIGTATTVSGKVVTFPFTGAITAGTLYCFNWNNSAAVKTSSAAVGGSASETAPGTIATYNSTATLQDSTNYSETIVSAGPPAQDQMTVSGTVPPSFNFSLSGYTDPFGNMTIGTVQNTTGSRTVSIITNAPNGWVLWVKDANSNGGKGSFNSTIAGYKITPGAAAGTANTLAAGTESYGFVTTTNTHGGGLQPGGAASVINLASAYDGTSATNAGTLDPVNFQPAASSNGTANGDVMNVKERAMITSTTPAANDYTDTITLVGAGRF